ncbi:hypothetical protein FHT85_004959 [Rhizobium sp. BK312]|uniref:hypothetical protein n=1 Tax=Rhizobium sp. BK312 TaxID=2587080 RepID=UPI000DDC118A|nr:hypothetical protein [Rhizobium sp. BK312]MBB3427950.1 hypothetical protein [Rhizobium sp. BK312]
MAKYSLAILIAVVFLLPLDGCARLPPLTPQARLPVADVIRHVDCEMWSAFYGNPGDLPSWFQPDKWAVSTSLTLKADGDIDMGIAYDHKYPHTNHTWDVGVSADVKQDGHRDTTITYSGDMKDLKNLKNDCQKPIAVASFGGHPLTGNLGIAEWRDRMIKTIDSFAEPDALSYANEFKLTMGAGAVPTLTLKVAKDSPTIGGSLSNDDTISLAFAKIKTPSPPTPIIVKVTQETHGGAGPKVLSITPSSPGVAPGGGVNPYTQQRLDQIQNQGVILRSFPDCRSQGLCQ